MVIGLAGSAIDCLKNLDCFVSKYFIFILYNRLMSAGLKQQQTTAQKASPYSDAYCEKVYKSFHDAAGEKHERV